MSVRETYNETGFVYKPGSPVEKAIEEAREVAPYTLEPVFVLGETGTGKEGIAQFIHNESNLGGHPLVAVNCGALTPALVESAFFGHEKGSFTGADRQHIGFFEEAQNGTIFLDEVTKMPKEAQTLLLRVLEQKRDFRRVGGKDILKANARVIAASNENLEKAVADGKLQEDLYYRLMAGRRIELPPLRERKGDIPALAEFFAGQMVEEYRKKVPPVVMPEFSDAALDVLQKHSWPGNVRELKGIVRNATIKAQKAPGHEITPDMIKFAPIFVGGSTSTSLGAISLPPGPLTPDQLRDIITNNNEIPLIQAAKQLGINRNTLFKLIADAEQCHGLAWVALQMEKTRNMPPGYATALFERLKPDGAIVAANGEEDADGEGLKAAKVGQRPAPAPRARIVTNGEMPTVSTGDANVDDPINEFLRDVRAKSANGCTGFSAGVRGKTFEVEMFAPDGKQSWARMGLTRIITTHGHDLESISGLIREKVKEILEQAKAGPRAAPAAPGGRNGSEESRTLH